MQENENSNDGQLANKVSYWEERTINIGNYESRKLGLSFSHTIYNINFLDQKVAFSEHASEELPMGGTVGAMGEVADKLISEVNKKLDVREKQIRRVIDMFDGSDLTYSPRAKGEILGVFGSDAKKAKIKEKKQAKRERLERKKRKKELLEKQARKRNKIKQLSDDE